MKRYNLRNILVNTIWIILGIGTIVLLLAAMNKKDSSHCRAVEIVIEGAQNNLFIDRNDIQQMLEKMSYGNLRGKAINTFNLSAMEAVLEKNKWIKNARLYFDNNDVLRINIIEREPVARIFSADGNSFYIDSAIFRLPLSSKFSARLPVFTNFPVIDRLSKADSNLLTDIKNISLYLSHDLFWMAQVEQVDITPERSFEMIPKIGNQVIIFGMADNYREKFNNLLTFYKSVQSKVGWNKYSKINVAYKGQVIAVKKGAEEIKMDSLRTIQLMKQLVANAQRLVNDSANNIQLVQPKEDNRIPYPQVPDDRSLEEQPGFIDNVPDSKITTIVDSPEVKKNIEKVQPQKIKFNSNEKRNTLPKKTVKKPIIEKPPVENRQPKAVMQPANDY